MADRSSVAVRKHPQIRERLANVARFLAAKHRSELEEWKKGAMELNRPDWLWESLLLSFSTMGRSKGAVGLIRNPDLHSKVTYEALAKLAPHERRSTLKETLRAAKWV